MDYCLICKEIVGERYELKAEDKNMLTATKGFICNYCFNKLIESRQNSGFFRLSQFRNWIKHRRDSHRVF